MKKLIVVAIVLFSFMAGHYTGCFSPPKADKVTSGMITVEHQGCSPKRSFLPWSDINNYWCVGVVSLQNGLIYLAPRLVSPCAATNWELAIPKNSIPEMLFDDPEQYEFREGNYTLYKDGSSSYVYEGTIAMGIGLYDAPELY